MLDTNRVDIGVVDRFNGLVTLHQLGIKKIRMLEPPLSRIKFYNFLHKKHEDIIPRITESLQQMHNDGKIKEIWNNFESQYIQE